MKSLAADLSAMLDELPPQKVEIVAMTGEMFSEGALRMARLYDKATNGQRTALDEIAKAFEKCPPRGRR